jgi:hypothetical protein
MFVPQLLEKNPTKFRISKVSFCKHPPPRQFRTLLENRDETTRVYVCVCVSVCVWGGDTPCLYLIGYTHTI